MSKSLLADGAGHGGVSLMFRGIKHLLNNIFRLSLAVMTLNPRCEDVETVEGVAVTVTGVAQVKVVQNNELLMAACEQFLGRDVDDVKLTILHTLEGHLRSILGTLSVEAIYSDRDSFARLVREVAEPDVAHMGIEILSFTIKDVFDRVQYLDSLGRGQIALIKSSAQIGVAEAERDAGIKEAEFEKQLVDERCNADGSIADSKLRFEMLQTEYDQEVNVAKAEAELAYELQAAKEQQQIKNEELGIQLVERRKQIEIEQQEITRNEKSLECSVRIPAEAEAYRTQTIAEGQRTTKIMEATASAGGIRLVGAANATAVEALGAAEADGLVQMAAAFGQFSDAAKLSLVLNALPELAAEVAAPLARTGEIVLIGGDAASTTSTRVDDLVVAAKTLLGAGALPAGVVADLSAAQAATRRATARAI
uniref:PHB domain-containing protein n=1 Tax=Mesocestoides corti TaxID=53468 RepID=A0A5K3F928_MESCO